MFRQGDILIAAVEGLPVGAQPLPREEGLVVLARGDVGGHVHAIAGDNVALFRPPWGDGERFLEVSGTGANLEHEEHAAIWLHEGVYRVIHQVEYDPYFRGGAYVAD